jgi:hypothetical protein
MASAEGENWSQVAALAFEKRLADLFQTNTIADMEAAIKRLRVSRIEYHETINAEGYQAGRRWAETTASFAQLKRIGEFTDQLDAEPSNSWGGFFGGGNVPTFTVSECLACYIHGQEPDRDLARDFWRSALGCATPPEPNYFHAFAEGAAEIYHAVVGKL